MFNLSPKIIFTFILLLLISSIACAGNTRISFDNPNQTHYPIEVFEVVFSSGSPIDTVLITLPHQTAAPGRNSVLIEDIPFTKYDAFLLRFSDNDLIYSDFSVTSYYSNQGANLPPDSILILYSED